MFFRIDGLPTIQEVDDVAGRCAATSRSRFGEQTPNIVIVQGDSKETLRLFGETHAVGPRCNSTDGFLS